MQLRSIRPLTLSWCCSIVRLQHGQHGPNDERGCIVVGRQRRGKSRFQLILITHDEESVGPALFNTSPKGGSSSQVFVLAIRRCVAEGEWQQSIGLGSPLLPLDHERVRHTCHRAYRWPWRYLVPCATHRRGCLATLDWRASSFFGRLTLHPLSDVLSSRKGALMNVLARPYIVCEFGGPPNFLIFNGQGYASQTLMPPFEFGRISMWLKYGCEVGCFASTCWNGSDCARCVDLSRTPSPSSCAQPLSSCASARSVHHPSNAPSRFWVPVSRAVASLRRLHVPAHRPC